MIDYDDIAQAWVPLRDRLDHRYLNEIPGLETPSTENLLVWMFSEMYVNQKGVFFKAVWPVLERIRIKESSTTWCEMSKVEWIAFCGPNA